MVREYRGRHQPRTWTTSIAKIGNVERYDRYYDITYDAIQNRMFPTVALPAGSLVVRITHPKYDARGIPPASPTDAGNRYSGLRLDGRAGHGALYIGTVAGVLREHVHYSMPEQQQKTIWKPGANDATAEFMRNQRTGAELHETKKLFLFQVNQTMLFADLRLTALTSFFQRVLQSGGRERYGFADDVIVDFLARLISDQVDYSAPRGMADAIYDTSKRSGLCGVCAFSSRADKDNGFVVSAEGDKTGGLVHAVFGAGSSLVSTLTPIPKKPKPGKVYASSTTPADEPELAFNSFQELMERIEPKREIVR
jgi:hypothetical protein